MFPYNTKVFLVSFSLFVCLVFFWRRRKVPRDRNTISKSMWLTCQRGVKQGRESELIRFQTLRWGFWVARQAHPELGILASWSWRPFAVIWLTPQPGGSSRAFEDTFFLLMLPGGNQHGLWCQSIVLYGFQKLEMRLGCRDIIEGLAGAVAA